MTQPNQEDLKKTIFEAKRRMRRTAGMIGTVGLSICAVLTNYLVSLSKNPQAYTLALLAFVCYGLYGNMERNRIGDPYHMPPGPFAWMLAPAGFLSRIFNFWIILANLVALAVRLEWQYVIPMIILCFAILMIAGTITHPFFYEWVINEEICEGFIEQPTRYMISIFFALFLQISTTVLGGLSIATCLYQHS